MKIITETQDVESSPPLAQATMTINPSDTVLWQALSTTIYTKARWMLEYAQNAHDVDKNWVLTLPSLLSPYCEFKDNGPSMSRDFMLSLGDYAGCGFCTAFSSTKRESNALSGGFGIGRLSGPQGTIFECRNDDMIRTYVLIKNEDCIPGIQLQSEVARPSDVPIGVTVRVPVATGKFSQTREDAQRFLQYFDPIPAGITPPEYLLSTNTWAIQKTRQQGRSAMTVIVGGYPFQVSYSDLLSNSGYGSPLYQLYREIAENSAVVLWLPVGSVEIALNRESLRFSDQTCRALKTAMLLLREEAAAQLTAQLNTCQTRWEAQVLYAELVQSFGIFYTIADPSTLFYQTERLFSTTGTHKYRALKLPHGSELLNCDRGVYRSRGGLPGLKFKQCSDVAVARNTRFIVVDGVTRAKARLENVTGAQDNLYLIPEERLDYYMNLFGNPPTERLSSFALPVSMPAAPRHTRPHAMFVYEQHGKGCFVSSRTLPQVLPLTGVWVPTHNKSVETETDRQLLQTMFCPENVIGVPKRDRGLIPDTWTTLQDYVAGVVATPTALGQARYAHEVLALTPHTVEHNIHQLVCYLSNYCGMPNLLRYQ